jgi:hypothetical protein
MMRTSRGQLRIYDAYRTLCLFETQGYNVKIITYAYLVRWQNAIVRLRGLLPSYIR